MHPEWSPNEGLPPQLTRHDLAVALRAADATMMPADARAFAVAMDRLLGFAVAFNIPMNAIEETVTEYQTALADLPADLLMLAVDRIRATYRWGNRMPFPSDISGAVRTELDARRGLHRVLSTAKWKMDQREDERQAAIRREAGDRLERDFVARHGMSTAEAQLEWRRRQGLEGPAVTRIEIMDAIKGAMSIYAPGCEPKVVPADPITPRRRSLQTSVQNALRDLAQNIKNDPEVIAQIEAENASETGSETVPKKMAETVCHALPSLCYVSAIVFGLFSHHANAAISVIYMAPPCSAIGRGMTDDGIYRVEETRVDKTQSSNYHRAWYSYPELKLLPRKGRRCHRTTPSAYADPAPPTRFSNPVQEPQSRPP